MDANWIFILYKSSDVEVDSNQHLLPNDRAIVRHGVNNRARTRLCKRIFTSQRKNAFILPIGSKTPEKLTLEC